MQCKNHASVPAVERCVGCAELFCENCLVEVLGQKYCASCKVIAVKEPPLTYGEGYMPCEAASKALTYAIVGVFCFGFVLGPMAVVKAVEARKEIREDPSLSGLGSANVGLLLGIAVSIFNLIFIIGGAIAKSKGGGE